MKKLNKYILLLLALVVFIPACKDEDLVILPEWESAVHGLTVFTPTGDPDVDPISNFKSADPSVEISFDMLWNSIDSKLNVTKIEVFAQFNEAYVDPDGNPKTAKHGGDDGRLLFTFEGAEVPANRTPFTFTVSQDEIYSLYSSAEFDYGTGTLPVWGTGSIKPDRDTSNNKFVPGDSFQIRWTFTTDDGRVFDSWGISVCTEFPGANCSVNWTVVCAEVIEEPVGDWVFNMVDTYGDGWQGGYISVMVDGAEAAQVTMPDYWTTGLGPYSALTETITVPDGTTSLTFNWNPDQYNVEVEFTIVSPRGNVVVNAANPATGPLQLDLCKE